MATKAQIKSNQRRTRAAANSQTKPVIEPSGQQAFDELEELEEDLRISLAPTGAIEEAIFQTLLHAHSEQLRLRKTWARFHATNPDLLGDPQAIKTYERLRRYTATADRNFKQALKELKSLQVARCQRCLATNQVERSMPTLAASVLLTKNTKRTQFPNPTAPTPTPNTEPEVPEYIAMAQAHFKKQAAEWAEELAAAGIHPPPSAAAQS